MAVKPKSASKKNRSEQSDLFHLAEDIILNVGVGIYIVQHGNFVYVSPLYQQLTGYSYTELIGTNSLVHIYPDDREMVRAKAITRLKGKIHDSYEYRFIRKNGAIMWILEMVTSIIYKGERAALGSFMDITERKKMEEAVRQSEERYRNILEGIEEGYYEVDLVGNLTFFNDSMCKSLGYSKEELMGMNNRQYTDQENAKRLFQAFNQVYRTGKPGRGFDHELIRKDGTKRYAEGSILLQKDSSGNPIGFRGIVRDITERKRSEQQLSHMATHDPLTGLPNRMLFIDRLKMALAQAKRNRHKLAVMMLDLDHFKNINDTLGHLVGDQLLKEMGHRLTSILRQNDTIARLGGDEFIILLPEIGRVEDSAEAAGKILSAFQRPFICDSHKLSSSTSIGIAIYPDDCQDTDSLLKNADMAMYYVKAHGRNGYQFFNNINIDQSG
jgi:diguanylate cyclase (GGDEF)-like protein/PAS domain S-box-containing protein